MPTLIGGNKGIATLRDLWTVMTDGNNTQHSCYGTGAAGCTQVEIPTANGYPGTVTGNATLYEYRAGQLISSPINPD